MKITPETALKIKATRAIKRLGGYSLPIPGGQFGVNGAPDRIVWWRGQVWALEFKAGKNGLRPAQKAIKAEIEARGGAYVLVRTLDDLYGALGLGPGGGELFKVEGERE